MLLSSSLLALALLPTAEATKVKSGRIIQNTTTNAGDIVVVTSDDGTVSDVVAEVTTGAGTETARLVASDAWLHGSTSLAALPTTEGRVTLTVYDTDSAPLVSFSTTFSAKLGWGTWDTTIHQNDVVDQRAIPDIGLLGARSFATAAGYDLGFDLNGADTPTVAYADLTITETVPCVDRACTGDVTTKTTTAEVGFDDLGLVWQGAVTLPLDGVCNVAVTTSDATGALDTTRAEIVGAWDDGGAGISALPTDEDPLTSVALHAWNIADGTWHAGPTSAFTIVSDGWALDDTLPTYAEVTLANGEVWDIPANSYQVGAATPITFKGDPAKERFYVTVDGVTFKAASAVGRRGICQYGKCFSLSQGTDGAWTLSATAYAATAAELPTSVKVSLTGAYGAATPTQESYALAYGDEVAVVFANEVSFAGDPAGLDLTGRVRLRGRQTLLVGKFEGQFGVDPEGDLGLGFIGSGGATVSKGDILIGGEPIDFEKTDTDGDGVVNGPPAVVFRVYQGGYGNGYMPPAGQGQTQQAQLL